MSDGARHRLFESVLRRLARRPDAGGLVLRGGMLLRHWFRPHPRPAADLDLMTTAALDPALLAEEVDGVAFGRVRAEAICLETGNPGVRAYVTGTVAGREIDVHIDVTLCPPIRPAPVLDELAAARVWVCRPETVLAQKVQAIAHLGLLDWRPKDLDDLRRLLSTVTFDPAAARDAVMEHLAVIGKESPFGPESWWGMKRSSARWLDYVLSPRGRLAPGDLGAVVTEVSDRLKGVVR